MLIAVVGFTISASAQEKDANAAVLQKLSEIENRLNDMDKRYEIRFVRIEERYKSLEEKINALDTKLDIKIGAVNQRIDDKFNLIVGLLGLIAAFLALPYIPKFLERYKAQSERKEDIQRLQEQINELKALSSQRPGPTR
jgi:predicted  nucleic acid-binding Zn-ribbon protein